MKPTMLYLVAGALLASAHTSFAQDRTQDPANTRAETVRDRDIYGYQLMTPEERTEYRGRMRAAQSAEERQRIRAEHHAQMQERAKERGIALPDMPSGPAGRGGGMGPGGGMMGPGGGMGPGMGRGAGGGPGGR